MAEGGGESIKVVVRVRGLIAREGGEAKAFTTEDSTDLVQQSNKKRWTFDRVYSPKEDTRSLYADTVCPLVEAAISGFNSTIFAYGQTSSGKTFTMYGTDEEDGIINMAVENLFYAIEESPDRRFLMQVGFLEIYNEKVNDLLSDPKTRPVEGLKMKEDRDGQVTVDGMETVLVTCKEEIIALMEQGERNRHTAKTKMNERSSRSHTIFRIILESTDRMSDEEEMESSTGYQVTQSQLNLVDLAGSERANQTGATGNTLKEGAHINTSLLTLSTVIGKLSSGKKLHINYRDSSLTRILQNSLGGNAKTAIICAVTPAAMSEEQTVSTLRFATQAKAIKNNAKVNEVLDDAAKMNRMKKELAEMKKALEASKVASGNNREVELQEALDQATRDKEEYMQRMLAANEKMLTSSQAAPPRKSMMPTKARASRRATVCGQALRKTMRMSMFQRPLLPLGSDFKLPTVPCTTGQANLSFEAGTNLSFKATSNMSFEQQLAVREEQQLEELEEEEEEEGLEDLPDPNNDSVFSVPPPARRPKKTISFASSPSLFASPLRARRVDDALNVTDGGGTPKAVIREQFRRVSRHLGEKELELVRLEREHQELQEFTRLEDEAGVLEDRRASVASDPADLDRLRLFERNFADSEKLNLGLSRDLAEVRGERQGLADRLAELEQEHATLREGFEQVCKSEGEAEERSRAAEAGRVELAAEARALRETNQQLEGAKLDFDLRFEMGVEKKEAKIKELVECLEAAYRESGSPEEARARGEQVAGQANRLAELEEKVTRQQEEIDEKAKLVEEAKEVKEEAEHIKEGMEALSKELETVVKENSKLSEEIVNKDVKHSAEVKQVETKVEDLVDEVKKAKEESKAMEAEKSNMELSNQSLLENLDDLQRQFDDAYQKNSELLVSSAELERFNLELKEEMGQLKEEVEAANGAKQQLEVDLEEAIMAKEEAEGAQEEATKAQEEADVAKGEAIKAKDEAVAAKESLEEFINTSTNTEEVEEMKKELARMEEQVRGAEPATAATVLSKLSATLVGLEETMLGDTSLGGQDMELTLGNQTLGLPTEVVEEIKAQLLELQVQLLAFGKVEEENKQLRKVNQELEARVEEAKADVQTTTGEAEEREHLKAEVVTKPEQVELEAATEEQVLRLRSELEESRRQLEAARQQMTTGSAAPAHLADNSLAAADPGLAHLIGDETFDGSFDESLFVRPAVEATFVLPSVEADPTQFRQSVSGTIKPRAAQPAAMVDHTVLDKTEAEVGEDEAVQEDDGVGELKEKLEEKETEMKALVEASEVRAKELEVAVTKVMELEGAKEELSSTKKELEDRIDEMSKKLSDKKEEEEASGSAVVSEDKEVEVKLLKEEVSKIQETNQVQSQELEAARSRLEELEQVTAVQATELEGAKVQAKELEHALKTQATELEQAKARSTELELAKTQATELELAKTQATELELAKTQAAELELVKQTQDTELEQANKAQDTEEQDIKLQAMELEQATKQLAAMKQVMQDAEEVAEVKEKLEEKEVELAKVQEASHVQTQQLEAAKTKVEELEEQLETKTAAAEGTAGQLEEQEETIKDIALQLREAEKKVEDLELTKDALATELEGLRTELEDKVEEVAEKEEIIEMGMEKLAGLKEQLQSNVMKIQDLESQVEAEEHVVEKSYVTSTRDEHQDDVNIKTEQLESLEVELEAANKKVELLEDVKTELEAANLKVKELESVKEKLEVAESKVELLHQVEAELDASNTKVEELKTGKKELEDVNKALEAASREVEEGRGEVARLERELEEVKVRLEAAREAAEVEGHRLELEVQELRQDQGQHADQAAEVQEKLVEKEAELAEVQEASQVQSQQLEAARSRLEELEQARAVQTTELERLLVELRGKVEEAADKARMVDEGAELVSELRKQLAESEADVAQITDMSLENAEKLEEAKTKLEELAVEHEAAQARLVDELESREEQVEALTEAVARLEEANIVQARELEGAEAALEAKVAEVEGARRDMAKMVELEHQDTEGRLEAVRQEIGTKEQEVEALRAAVRQVEAAKMSQAQDLEAKTEELAASLSQQEQLEEAMRRQALVLETKVEQLEAANRQLEGALESQAKKLKEQTEELEDAYAMRNQADKLEATLKAKQQAEEATKIKAMELASQVEEQQAVIRQLEEARRVQARELEAKAEAQGTANRQLEAGQVELVVLEAKVAELEGELQTSRHVKSEEVARLEAAFRRLAEDKLGLEEQLEAKARAAGQLEEQEETNKDITLQLREAEKKVGELETDVTKLKDNVEDAEKLRELVEEACDKQDEELKTKTEQIEKLSEDVKRLHEKLVEQKNYSDQVFELNKQLKSPFQSSSRVTEEVKQKIAKLEGDLKKAKEDLGKKNIEYAGLRVDVEKGELEYKKKCQVLQGDLEYEKAVVARLTQDLRRSQAAAMDTTIQAPRGRPAAAASTATNTSAAADSPVWSSGSGAIKEIRLHEAESQVRILEAENKKRKEHEEFYINKAREWKNRALKYERVLEKNSLPVPGKENQAAGLPQAAPAPSPAPLQPRPNLSNLERLRQHNAAAADKETNVTATEDLQLVLDRNGPPRRTESDFRLPPAAAGRQDDCKQQ